jgi:hypothetical protein
MLEETMSETAPPPRLGELTNASEMALAGLLECEHLKAEQWLMRISISGETGRWEPLATDTETNDRMIQERIALSARPIVELAVGYVGMVDWRGAKRQMAYLQYFKAGYAQGLLCLRHVKPGQPPKTFEAFGGFLVVNACKNIWI